MPASKNLHNRRHRRKIGLQLEQALTCPSNTIGPGSSVTAGRSQALQKKVSPYSVRTTLKPAGTASTLKS